MADASGSVRLTPSDARLHAALVERAGEVAPAEQLARAIWGQRRLDAHRRGALRAHVYELRRKLRAAGVPAAIEPRPGVGYGLSVSASPGGG